MTDVAITGLGLVTPFGRGVDTYWRALLAGDVALAEAEDPTPFGGGGEPVGQIPAGVLALESAEPTPPVVARRQALLQAVIADALAECGRTQMPHGSWLFLVGHLAELRDGVPADAAAFVDDPAPADLVGHAAHVVATANACASALFGLSLARHAISSGLTRCAVVAGVAVLNRFIYTSMRTVRAVSGSAARPWDVRRAGISLGEGAGAVVLEPADQGADLLLAGGVTRVSGASPSASDEHEVLECMRSALHDAGEVWPDYVHAHATGTVQGDASELAALEALARSAGNGNVVAGSHKGAVGHLLQASGFLGLATAAQVLRTGTAPPTPGLEQPEPAEFVTLPTTALALPHAPRCALVNSFGFGGNNASVTLLRC